MSGVNARRGEIAAEFDGKQYRLCLTLGALAELEQAFGVGNLADLAARFTGGKLAAEDLVRIVGAGLRAGGHAIDDEAVRHMHTPDGAAGFVRIAGRLLAATFGTRAEKEETPPNP
ncbi:gene transfer agent family protein [Mesorhizobium xinjiangense]|uniref:gene transfer agent family protein n=1 Tax=Mesorhizobium xinjiangense TaxID=2678685 RepID=UPI0012ECBEB8|nr:gene transfer agent family protein [Mesorhizobium xinjiangense]